MSRHFIGAITSIRVFFFIALGHICSIGVLNFFDSHSVCCNSMWRTVTKICNKAFLHINFHAKKNLGVYDELRLIIKTIKYLLSFCIDNHCFLYKISFRCLRLVMEWWLIQIKEHHIQILMMDQILFQFLFSFWEWYQGNNSQLPAVFFLHVHVEITTHLYMIFKVLYVRQWMVR